MKTSPGRVKGIWDERFSCTKLLAVEMRQEECSSLLMRWLWPSQPMTPSISSTWWTELMWTTDVEISRQGWGWWTSESHRSFHTGWKVVIFPSSFVAHRVKFFFYILKEVVIAVSLFKELGKKITKTHPTALCLWLSISLFLFPQFVWAQSSVAGVSFVSQVPAVLFFWGDNPGVPWTVSQFLGTNLVKRLFLWQQCHMYAFEHRKDVSVRQ